MAAQNNQGFKVIFIDYGSSEKSASEIANLISQYPFVTYHYNYCSLQLWSRAKAINIGLHFVKTDFVFIADIDMIFSSDFVHVLENIKNPKQSVFFKVGFLNEKETQSNKKFEDYKVAYESSPGAQGLSLFPTEALLSIRGFDEFFHLWGGEDEDVHSRLKMSGLEVNFFDEKILMLHQWHPTYRNSLNKKLTTDLQHNTITKINQEHLRMNSILKNSIVNKESWGNMINKYQFEKLTKPDVFLKLQNKKEIIDNFLLSVLPKLNNQILEVLIYEDPYPKTLKYCAKRLLKKSVPEYYSLKEINDVLLLHLIAFYSDAVYKYVVEENLKNIKLTIQL
ncbi:hypothetical protein FEM08_23150 [Flavobacterium gilvum]|nr:hypothetical protein FEM08_23150 [Flavobacterium gilvum]